MKLAKLQKVAGLMLAVAVLLLGSTLASAQCSQILVWNVLSYEDDPAGQDGNDWYGVGEVTAFSGPLTYDTTVNEYTIYMHGIVRNGDQVLVGSGTDAFGNDYEDYNSVFDDGGLFDVYEDASMNRAYTPFPPNGDVPSKFSDGTLYLRGTISNMFTLVRVFTGGFRAGEEEGNFEATVSWTDGSHLGELDGETEGYTFAGVARNSFIGIPDGFIHELAGQSLRCPVGTQESTWGQVKAKFRTSP
jgi:hypothetical protein